MSKGAGASKGANRPECRVGHTVIEARNSDALSPHLTGTMACRLATGADDLCHTHEPPSRHAECDDALTAAFWAVLGKKLRDQGPPRGREWARSGQFRPPSSAREQASSAPRARATHVEDATSGRGRAPLRGRPGRRWRPTKRKARRTGPSLVEPRGAVGRPPGGFLPNPDSVTSGVTRKKSGPGINPALTLLWS